ncbi:RidA family protein [Kineococcus gynurae]|uniref:RidA family protein n=1 Tax=Kineococcus gynurae TaxID=452979 RepID=A0ABV5LUC8_9ACTN
MSTSTDPVDPTGAAGPTPFARARVEPDPTNASPFYAQGVAVTGATRWLHVSGQVGVDAHGVPGDGITAQTQLATAGVRAVLEAGGMGVADVVQYRVYLTDPAHVGPFAEAAAAALPADPPATTLLVVAALAAPGLLVEIEAVAAA